MEYKLKHTAILYQSHIIRSFCIQMRIAQVYWCVLFPADVDSVYFYVKNG